MAQVKSAETGTAPAAILGTHPDFDDAGSNFMRRTHVESLLCSGHHGHREKRRTQGGFPKPKKKRHEQDEYVFGLEFHTFLNNNLRVDY